MPTHARVYMAYMIFTPMGGPLTVFRKVDSPIDPEGNFAVSTDEGLTVLGPSTWNAHMTPVVRNATDTADLYVASSSVISRYGSVSAP